MQQKPNRKKRAVIITFTAVLIVAAVLCSCLVSLAVFDIANPISAVSGFVKVTVAKADYAAISKSVILAQPTSSALNEYMQSRGFTELEDKQLGAMRVFTNGEIEEHILFSVNGCYSKWVWQYTDKK